MKLSEARYDNSATGCCAPADPAEWHEQVHHWRDALFVKDHVHEILHVPVDFGVVMRRDTAAIDAAEAWPLVPVTLSDERSPWGADLYIAVDRPVPGRELAILSGTYLSRLYQGSFREVGHWMQDMKSWVAHRGQRLEHLYLYYATCPKCAHKLGHNDVVLVAQVA